MSHAQELPAAPSAVTALSGAEASGAASHSSEGNGIHSFGGQVSPRAARSQISTAVSFEGARAAGSAALPSRSLEEESALSAAEGDVECSHSAEPNQAAPGSMRPRGGRLPRPSNSLISTAVQPASPHGHLQQPVSPKLNRANSVVSHTAPGGRPQSGRAGTPASVYGQGQGFLLPSRARQSSPVQQLAAEQDRQTTATAGVGLHHPGVLQPQQAWQQMQPALPGLQALSGLAAARQQDIQQSLQPHQQRNIMHSLEHRESFDGHHRSSDNGGGRPSGHLVHRALDQAAGQQAHDVGAVNGTACAAAGPARTAAGPSLATGAVGQRQQTMPQQQPLAAMQQPSMQLFHNALAGLPTAVAGGLLQGVFGQNPIGAGGASAGYGPAVAAGVNGAPVVSAGAIHSSQAAIGATQGSGAAAGANSGQQSTIKKGGGAAAVPSDLLQQLGVQLTPALLAVLQGQAGSGSPADAPRIPGLPYTQQQLQQALSLLLAGLASQAEQYGLVFPGIGNGTATGQQQMPSQVATTGMRPPPVPCAQAKSCDSSIQGAPVGGLGGSAPVANAAAAAGVVPPMPQAHGVSPMAAAAGAVGQSCGYGRQAQQLGLQQMYNNAFEPPQHQVAASWPQQQQAPIQPGMQQRSVQPSHWRSPSPSPVPLAHAAARTSAAGEGHGSRNLGGQAAACLQLQHFGDAAAAAISSAGGASRAGGGLTSEEGEAEAPEAEAQVPHAAQAPVAQDDAGQEASIGDAAHEYNGWQEDPIGVVMQQAATSPILEHQQHAPAAAVGYAVQQRSACHQHEHQDQYQQPQQHHMHQQQPASQHLILHHGDAVHAAASVHATMMSEDNASGNDSDADSEQSSTHSGGSNSNRGGAGVGQQGGAEVEIVSQLCGASHSASPPPSASRPAAATATGPVSGNTGVGSGVAAGSEAAADAAAVAGLMDAAGQGAVPARQAGGTGGRHETHHAPQQHQQQRPSASAHRSKQHVGDGEQGGDQQQGQRHNPRDSSLAMATAGPTGTRSTTVSTNSGTVDMSIHNDSQRSGAGSQGDAPAHAGWAAEEVDDMQGAANSRDGEARGEPPGAFETAESGRAADHLYPPQLPHLQQQHHQQHQHMPAASPVPGHSAAGPGSAAAFSPPGVMSGAGGVGMYNHAAAGAAGLSLATAALPAGQQQQPAGFACASTPGDADGYAHAGSPSLQGCYSSSNVGIPGVSVAGPVAGMPGRESSAVGDAPNAPSNHVVSAVDEVDAGSALLLGAAVVAHELQGDNQACADTSVGQGGPAPGTDDQPQPAAAQHIEQGPLCAAFSVTSQLQPTGEQHAATATGTAAQHHGQHLTRRQPQQQVRRPRHQHHQAGGRGGGSCVGTNLDAAPPGSVITTSSQAQPGQHQGHVMPAADAVPQVTEIHGHFEDHAVPATAAAAQMAAAAAAAVAGGQHLHAHSDVQPQVTELHGMLGASAGTAAEAQLAAAAAAAEAVGHGLGRISAAAPGGGFTGGGITGSTGVGDGRLPPLPHAHGGRTYTSHQHRPPLAAAGSSRIGAGAAAAHATGHGLGAHLASPPPCAAHHSRAHYSPPAVNFDPHVPTLCDAAGHGSAPDTGSAGAPDEPIEGTGDVTPATDMCGQGDGGCSPVPPSAAAVAANMFAVAVEEAASPVAFVAGDAAVNAQHLQQQQQQQQQCPGSPSHAQVQGNSQLGQQDGSRGSPPAGMGRVGSVPPQDVDEDAGVGGEVGVVEQQPHHSRHTATEDAGSHQIAAVLDIQQQQQQEQQQEQEADGPSHATFVASRQRQCRTESKSGATSPSQQHKRTNSHTAAVAAAAAARQGRHDRQQLQQHWQLLQGRFHEGAGQVGGRAASMRFSCGQAEGSVAPGISSKIYGSVSAGFASGSKAEGSPSHGVGLDGCSYGNVMASGANGHHPASAQQNGREQHEINEQQQQAQSNSIRGRGRPWESPAGATAAAALQEGEGSHGSRSQEARSCKRQRTSCEAVSVHHQQQQHMTSSMQTTEA